MRGLQVLLVAVACLIVAGLAWFAQRQRRRRRSATNARLRAMVHAGALDLQMAARFGIRRR